MNRVDLQYFCLLAEERSFTRAARKLYISQQALSSRILKLEKEYDAQLVKRDNPLVLTKTGEILYEYALRILAEWNSCDRLIQNIVNSTKGTLSIGIPVSRGTIMLPRLCTAFHKMYPHIQITLFEGNSTAQVEEQLMLNKLDFSIGYVPQDTTNTISHLLYTERYELIVPIELLKNRFSQQQLREIVHTPQYLSIFDHIPFVTQSENTKAGQVLKKMCRETDFIPHSVLETSNIITALNLCAAGIGACVVPSIFMKEHATLKGVANDGFMNEFQHKFVKIQLKTHIGISPIAINHLRTKPLTQADKCFIALAESLFAE